MGNFHRGWLEEHPHRHVPKEEKTCRERVGKIWGMGALSQRLLNGNELFCRGREGWEEIWQLPVSASRSKQQAEESYLSGETMLALEEMGINRQALEIPSSRNSEDTWKIRPTFKIKIMKRDYALSAAAGISCTGAPSSFYRSNFFFYSSVINIEVGIKHASVSAPVEFRKGAGYKGSLTHICDLRCSLVVMELELVCSTRARPSAAQSNFCCVAFRQQKWDTFLSLKWLLVLCELIKKSRLFLSF